MTDLYKAVETALDSLVECARLLGSTQAQQWHGTYTAYDAKFEVAMYESIYKHKAALRTALAQPEQDISYTDIQMAELIMSDCGHSSDYTPLLDRIAGRLATYRQALNVDAIDISATCVDETEKREHEPVAWIGHSGNLAYSKNSFMPSVRHLSKPLYTAPPSKQEPVAWVKEGKVRVGFGRIEERKYVQFDQTLPIGTKLFAAPVSKREWVSLTDEKIEHEWVKWKASVPRYYGFAKGIEAALRSKNNG